MRRPRTGRPGLGGDGGALSLETALVAPLIALLMLVVLHAAVLARDALLVQSAAREAARTAATTTRSAAVQRRARTAADGRSVEVEVDPQRWGPGDVVVVTVRLASQAGGPLGPVELTGTASARVEPGVGR